MPLFAFVLTCAVLVGTAATAQAPLNPSVIFEGPGERTPLTHWLLRSDPSARGLALGWQRSCRGAGVTVPNTVDTHDYAGAAGTRNYDGSVAWYCTSFQAPHAGTYALGFQSANFRAQIFIDGHDVGSHIGPYLPFEVRSALAAGSHTVVVRIDWRNPGEDSRLGFHRTWFNWGGLNGEVSVRPIGASELSEPSIQTTVAGGEADVRVGVLLTNHGPSRTITPEGSLADGAHTITLPFAPLTLAHGRSATDTALVHVPQPALWSPSSPSLYEMTLSVPGESSYTARVGLRQISERSGHLLLNGRPIVLHGASIQADALGHGDSLTVGDDERIVAELKAIGANAARSQHPLDPILLERLDAAGIMLWQGVGPVEGAGNWYSSTPQLDASAEQQARTAVLAERLHPSVFAWNLVNEVAENGRNGYEVDYVRTLAHWLHSADPGRLVAVDVWGDHPPTHLGALYSDVDAVAETDYSGWYDSPLDSPSQLAALLRSRLRAMDSKFAGKVLVISEFGAESNALNAPGSPGSYSYQSRILAAHIAAYREDPHLSAMLIWCLRDYPLVPTFEGGSIKAKVPNLRLIEGINQKGLFTYAGQPKPAVAVVARLFARSPPADLSSAAAYLTYGAPPRRPAPAQAPPERHPGRLSDCARPSPAHRRGGVCV